LRQGERIVVVTGVEDNSFNGTYYVADGSGRGHRHHVHRGGRGPGREQRQRRAEHHDVQGRAVSGGTFYDATSFPEAYRGNFFYGDYIDGRSMRAVVGPGTTVQSVDYWSNSLAAPIDQAVGPNGALYTAATAAPSTGPCTTARRRGWWSRSSTCACSRDGAIAFSVSLARMPAGNVTVNVARTAGDTDVSVASGATLDLHHHQLDGPAAGGAGGGR
jgi:hypothetical protein